MSVKTKRTVDATEAKEANAGVHLDCAQLTNKNLQVTLRRCQTGRWFITNEKVAIKNEQVEAGLLVVSLQIESCDNADSVNGTNTGLTETLR